MNAERRARELRAYAGAPDLTSLLTTESIYVWNEASMMLGDTPIVIQRSPSSFAHSISTSIRFSPASPHQGMNGLMSTARIMTVIPGENAAKHQFSRL